ncbi:MULTISPECIES: DUF5615 family PIN-like protein [Halococcus]|uniref:DUF5615 domain-containing protein n=1 Tax=Halococcus salifodinae DSM 8989 TaxID=1227456 RepID=M0N3M0_9EURY|nr:MULTISPECIES: DUF5615 family PIN-like protein [Halococcus]EMA52466.1 hypothetical protein C450_10223 [Halococcus salifodinae DSM 8989]
MDPLSFRADEHVDSAFVTALRAEGYAVSAVDEGYERGILDEEHLVVCRETEQVMLTNDDDFVELAEDVAHAGIIRYTDQSHSPGEFVRAIRRIDAHFSPDAMYDHIEWLEQWL